MMNLLLEILWYITSPIRVTYYKPCLPFAFSCHTCNYFGNLNSSLNIKFWKEGKFPYTSKVLIELMFAFVSQQGKSPRKTAIWLYKATIQDTGRKNLGAFSGWLLQLTQSIFRIFSGDILLELVCLSDHDLNWISVQLFLSDSSFWKGY